MCVKTISVTAYIKKDKTNSKEESVNVYNGTQRMKLYLLKKYTLKKIMLSYME